MPPKHACSGNANGNIRCRLCSAEATGPWKCRGGGKRGKPNGGFPRFPPPLGNLATAARFPHFHRPSLRRMEKWKTKTRFPTFPRGASDDDDGCCLQPQIRRKEVGRYAASSLLFCAHPQPRFHAHPSIRKCWLETALRVVQKNAGRNTGIAGRRPVPRG